MTRVELAASALARRCSNRLSYIHMEPPRGTDPLASCLPSTCSAIELRGQSSGGWTRTSVLRGQSPSGIPANPPRNGAATRCRPGPCALQGRSRCRARRRSSVRRPHPRASVGARTACSFDSSPLRPPGRAHARGRTGTLREEHSRLRTARLPVSATRAGAAPRCWPVPPRGTNSEGALAERLSYQGRTRTCVILIQGQGWMPNNHLVLVGEVGLEPTRT